MATPFQGELRWVSFNFPPKGWAFANGQLLPINQNQSLFSLFGTTYGGDGRVNFALPDLRGRVATHQGNGLTPGERAGEEFHTVTQQEMPTHIHQVNATNTAGDSAPPSGKLLAGSPSLIYNSFGNPTTLQPATITPTGGSQPHENRQPFLVLNCIVALQGIFPSQT
jgi:microcystin-dependent protein